MAKRKTARKTITRYVKAKPKRRSNASNNPMKMILPAMGYGAVRGKVSQLIAPVTSKIPFGNLADEIGMGVLSYYAAKKGTGMVKKLGQAGLIIESAQAGQTLVAGNLLGMSTTSSTTQIYG